MWFLALLKEIDEAHAGEIVTLIPKGENLAQGASQKKVKVYERPNYPESNASSHKNVPAEKVSKIAIDKKKNKFHIFRTRSG